MLAQLLGVSGAIVKFTMSSHMYIYMYKFLFADACVSKAPVTLVTGLGACRNTCFRKVWFYFLKNIYFS